MTVPVSSPDPAQPHPALGRFLSGPAGEEQLLIVRAPLGMGARWFASGWVGHEATDRVVVWSRPAGEVDAFIDRVGALLDEHDGGRVAVVGGQDLPVGRLAGEFSARLAGPVDLLLTVDEIRDYAARPRTTPHAPSTTGRRPLPLTPERIHEKTGGWLTAVWVLVDDPLGAQAAKQEILAPLMHWLNSREENGQIAETAFLPELSEEILESFWGQQTGVGPGLGRLEELGLVVRTATGQWFMPILIREVLQDSVVEADPQRARELNEAAAEAMRENGGVASAIDTALRERAWDRLTDLVLDHWVDLYVKNAPALAKLVGRLPRFVLDGLDTTGITSRLVAATGAEAMEFIPTSVKPDYARDEIAHQLRVRTTRMYRTPDHRALTLGIAETGHLRLAGHYVEAGRAADRLRDAVNGAVDARRARPSMAGFANLQAGISLHLADRLGEARVAYEAAYYWARRGTVDFVQADAAGKLALLSVHLGSTDRARYWLERVEEPLASVRWGRPMVARAAELATVHVALAGLDLDGAWEVLDRLPPEPDMDEFWAAHAFVIALAMHCTGRGEAAASRVVELRQDRPHASASPLSERLLSEAYHACRLGNGHVGAVPGWDQSEVLANLETLRCLRAGDADGALRALRLPERTSRRHRNIAAMAGVIARTKTVPDTADEAVLNQLAAIHRQDGELSDLAHFHPMGWTPVFQRIGIVDDVGAARLAALASPVVVPEERPSLTPREQAVLHMLREGKTRRQMAVSTYRSENTIKGQLRSLYAKLGAASAQEALEQARHYGL